MTTQQFIEKATEGGWKPHDHFNEPCDLGSLMYEQILLDPAAWKAVGKVEGWKGACGFCYSPNIQNCEKAYGCEMSPIVDRWNAEMHRMIDALADGKTIEQFLETL